jgi:nucleotide-binding universal stress UspA family protein
MTDVASTIALRAASLKSDLIVICTHGEGGFRELLFGSVAQQVLGGGAIPVLLVHPAAGSQPPFVCRTIMVPLDQTAPSEAALPAAASLARAFGATIILSHVVPTVSTMPGERGAAAMLMPTAAAAMLEAEAERAAGYLQTLTSRLTGEGVGAQAAVERGEAVQALLSLIDARQVDLVVMTTHARAGMAAVWTGSVAPRFLPRVPVPVLLVRAPAD